ncbi:MAG TPA: PilT/PilU family type 4a pilus ATPase [Thermoanaerobaculia bacterium]|nr:PilT/PilU family type 4a pilus ATPase [Thermoanaerobaculia bacterium]
MEDYWQNQELNDLVREINETTASEPESAPALPADRADVREGDPLERALVEMARRGASDVLLIHGLPPVVRVDGALVRTGLPLLDEDDLRTMISPYLSSRATQQLDQEGSSDFSLRLEANGSERRGRNWRFRVNIHRQRGRLAIAVRALPFEIPTLQQLNLPQSLTELVRPARGLILISGPTGSGKSSTLAALIGEINRTSARHVITIEDPIEYEHQNDRAIIEQIEVGRDSPSFAGALRAALRQDPDVILVGEMRDLETVATAVTAAETGHLILSTLHTSDTAQALHRIIDVFPSAQQTQIRQQLALSLHAIVSQQLIPRIDIRGRIPATEVLIANHAIRQHIRTDRLQNIATELTLGKRIGMIALDDSLAELVHSGRISLEEAQLRARHPEELRRSVEGGG